MAVRGARTSEAFNCESCDVSSSRIRSAATRERRLDEVGRETQQAFNTRMVSKVSRKTAVNVFGTLSTMLNTARSWGYIAEPVKLGALALPETPLRPAARFFSGEEARQIIATARDPHRTMFAIAALLGLRAGEILGLTIDDLDFDKKLVHIQRADVCRRSRARRAELRFQFLNHLSRFFGSSLSPGDRILRSCCS
jgi:integrase